MCRSRARITSPQSGDGRSIGVADLTGDASVKNRDFGLDTRAMEEFAHYLMETGWLDTLEADLASMNSNKLGRPFEFTDKAIGWANRVRIVFKIGYRLARGMLNHFLRGLGLSGISLTHGKNLKKCYKGISQNEPCIRIVDFVAGSIQSNFEHGNNQYKPIIETKVSVARRY